MHGLVPRSKHDILKPMHYARQVVSGFLKIKYPVSKPINQRLN
jgi:hypothetical protein